MKKNIVFLLTLLFVLCFFGTANAGLYTFQPDDSIGNPADLWDLEHGHYYTWGIDWEVPSHEKVIGVSLFFDDIRNHDNGENDLWVNLLDIVKPAGAYQYSDIQSGQVNDFIVGPGIVELKHWEDLPSTAQDITYTLDTSELLTFIAYVSDGNFGFGFDPDCHFYNNGITLTIETAHAPLPGAMMLFSIGLLGLVGIRRTKK